jgi:hypothetical protein
MTCSRPRRSLARPRRILGAHRLIFPRRPFEPVELRRGGPVRDIKALTSLTASTIPYAQSR